LVPGKLVCQPPPSFATRTKLPSGIEGADTSPQQASVDGAGHGYRTLDERVS
jgi:hypothetical protein